MAPMVQILKQFNDCPDSEDSREDCLLPSLKGISFMCGSLCVEDRRRLAQIKGDKALTLPV